MAMIDVKYSELIATVTPHLEITYNNLSEDFVWCDWEWRGKSRYTKVIKAMLINPLFGDSVVLPVSYFELQVGMCLTVGQFNLQYMVDCGDNLHIVLERLN